MTPIDNKSLTQFIAAADKISTLRHSIVIALQSKHILNVSRQFLSNYHDLSDDTLESLGLAADILRFFNHQSKDPEFNFKPAVANFNLLPESADHVIKAIRLQIPQSPLSVSIGLKLLRDMLSSFESSVHFKLCLHQYHNAEAILNLIQSWGFDHQRVTLIAYEAINLFAQDNAISGQLNNGATVLLLPRAEIQSQQAEKELQILATAIELPVYRSRLFWEGGNILYDGHYCLIGANCIAKNICCLGLTEQQVIKAFSIEFDVQVIVLGDVKKAIQNEIKQVDLSGGQADFHIDLDISLLGLNPATGQPMAAVATAESSDKLLAAVLKSKNLFEQHFADRHMMRDIFVDHINKSMQSRRPLLKHYRKTLQANGYQILDLPDLRMISKFNMFGRLNTSFNYCNVIPSLDSSGNKRVHLFAYGIDELDNLAAACYQNAGITPFFVGNDVTANELLQLHGGLHCLYSKMG